MKKQVTILMLTLGSFLISCSGMHTVKGASNVPSGTKVSYGKLMNPTFARDYIGADVITEAQFYAPNPSKLWQTKVPKDHIVFQVLPLGGKAKSSPIGNDMSGDYVFIPKAMSDIVFELSPGDKIELRGGTRVRKGTIARSVEFVEFVATSMRKL